MKRQYKPLASRGKKCGCAIDPTEKMQLRGSVPIAKQPIRVNAANRAAILAA